MTNLDNYKILIPFMYNFSNILIILLWRQFTVGMHNEHYFELLYPYRTLHSKSLGIIGVYICKVTLEINHRIL